MSEQRRDQDQFERLKKAHEMDPRSDRMDDERGHPFRKPKDDKKQKERPQ
ncbi:hypothetical protein [Terricaulis sp.]